MSKSQKSHLDFPTSPILCDISIVNKSNIYIYIYNYVTSLPTINKRGGPSN